MRPSEVMAVMTFISSSPIFAVTVARRLTRSSSLMRMRWVMSSSPKSTSTRDAVRGRGDVTCSATFVARFTSALGAFLARWSVERWAEAEACRARARERSSSMSSSRAAR